jgi:hypothetical protein
MITVWKIAPGEGARVWDECREERCITINWLNHTNYALFSDKQEVKRALIKAKEGKGGGGAISIWHFCRSVQQGHVVVANEGLSRVVGIGLINSGYLPPDDARNPRQGKDDHRHARLVDWLIKKPVDLPRRIFIQPTVQRLAPHAVAVITRAYLKQNPELRERLDELFGRQPTVQRLGPAAEEAETSVESTYVAPEGDRREIAWQQIKKRRGRMQFREALLHQYAERCLVTGCGLVAVLEAAHIDPYRGEGNNHPGNGLLLRADIHTLFDLDLLGVEPDGLQVKLHPDIAQEYEQLDGKTLCCPANRRPSRAALKRRYRLFQKRKRWPL